MESTSAARELTMLVDYRNHFYMSVHHRDASMDLELMKKYFRSSGWELVTKGFPDINFRNDNYCGKPVLYQTSEDRDLFYKSYIEDVLLGLKLQGAVLIPEFHLFRAHHNKVFMEILRDLSPLQQIKNIKSRGYGTYEDFAKESSLFPSEVVVKPSEGYGSNGVKLLRDERSRRNYVKRLSRSMHPLDALKDLIRSYVWHCRKRSNHRRKLIVQNYIRDLHNDYKILVFGNKYYVLCRHNRKHDFRASGSGLFEYRDDLPEGLLDFAACTFQGFDSPYAAFDVGFNGRDYVLFEFQFVHMGTYTLEKSPFYFVNDGGRWKKISGASILEEELVRSVILYCDKSVSSVAAVSQKNGGSDICR